MSIMPWIVFPFYLNFHDWPLLYFSSCFLIPDLALLEAVFVWLRRAAASFGEVNCLGLSVFLQISTPVLLYQIVSVFSPFHKIHQLLLEVQSFWATWEMLPAFSQQGYCKCHRHKGNYFKLLKSYIAEKFLPT